MAGNTIDICDQAKSVWERLPFNAAFFEQLFEALFDGVYFVDRERKILYWNRAAEMLTGYSREEVLGRFCNLGVLAHTNSNGCRLCEGNCPLLKVVETGQAQSMRLFFRHKDRRRIAITIHAIAIKNEQGEIIGAIGIFRDASAAVALEDAYKKLRELSDKDALTGLANRRQLHKTFKDQLTLLKRNGIPFSIILLEIDHLLQLQDSLGIAKSDKMLIHLAQLLKRQCHGTDVIGRFAEEKFLILLRQRLESVAPMAERLRIAVFASAPEEMRELGLSASFGVTEATLDDTISSLLKRAADALNQAKTKGGNRVVSLEPALLA
jgi:diguanylate cyclase (GGDEF)-like protein/PAS domain S-box-containing protein